MPLGTESSPHDARVLLNDLLAGSRSNDAKSVPVVNSPEQVSVVAYVRVSKRLEEVMRCGVIGKV